MNPEELRLYHRLLAKKDMIYISTDGRKLYMLAYGMMVCLTGPDFRLMNDAEINDFAIRTLRANKDKVRPS